MTATVATATPQGFDGQVISVECDASKGLPSLQIVGLGNKAINEARQRVRSSLRNCDLPMPARRLTVNLAPADLPKHGSQFDLPIAVAIIAMSGLLKPSELSGIFMAGELGLDGSLKPVKGILQIIETARDNGAIACIVPVGNTEQAQLMTGLPIYALTSLTEVIMLLKKQRKFLSLKTLPLLGASASTQNLSAINGQSAAIRAATIAAAGRHHLLMTGPPGVGKSMLGHSLRELLPTMTASEVIATTKIQSLTGTAVAATERPFRAPHHSASQAAIVGGGASLQPGELSLAHCGILFLDELPEFSRATLEALRQPLEDRRVHIARASTRLTLPANVILVAARNPCPCGYYGDSQRNCTCSAATVERYARKISGPLIDRFDLSISLDRPSSASLMTSVANKTTQQTAITSLRKSITKAWQMQQQRYLQASSANSTVDQAQLLATCQLSRPAQTLLQQAADRLRLSPRAYFKTLRVARTIADLADEPRLTTGHIAEALQYRHRPPD